MLTAEDIKAVRSNSSGWKALPRNCYTDQTLFNAEVERIFSAGWIAIGFDAAVAERGSVRPVELAGMPLVMVRDNNDQVRVFHNVSVYDGYPVATEIEVVEELVNEYHGWRYDLGGQLLEAPTWHCEGEPDIARLRAQGADLVEIRSNSWSGVRFINIDGTASPFAGYRATIAETLKAVSLQKTELLALGEHDGLTNYSVKSNWKTLWEDLAASHCQHSEMVDGEVARNFIARPHTPTAAEAKLTEFPSLTEVKIDPQVAMLYPNLCVTMAGSFFEFCILLPESASSSVVQTALFVPPGDDGQDCEAVYSELAEELDRNKKSKHLICERIQRGRNSPAYRRAILSPSRDRARYSFHNWILDDLLWVDI